MTSTDARPRTPSVSELQAALLAVRNGEFATGPAGSGAASPVATVALDEVAGRPSARLDVEVFEVAGRAAPGRRRPAPPSLVTASPAERGVWLLGAHGGSGARCLAAVLSGTRNAGKQWPAPTEGREQIALVCRSSQRGLSAAQDHARHFRDGELLQRLDLLGVIVSADGPGRVPPPLRRLEKLLSGAVPILGEIPWQPAWRLGPAQPLAEAPAWLSKLQQSLAAAVTR